MKNKFSYKWYLSDGFPAHGIAYHGNTVFSCFAGAGGSSMGYRLAGYKVIGFNELDGRQANQYITNLGTPEFQYIEDIRSFRSRDNLPKGLFEIDILDGSPPCTTFSTIGQRQKACGIEKKFKEGQKLQRLDDLVFEYIQLGLLLKPKIIIMENVKGFVIGYGKNYLSKIGKMLETDYAYTWDILDASRMGVPQKRERFFLFCIRKDLLPYIKNNGLLIKTPIIQFEDMQIVPYSEIELEAKKSNSQHRYINENSKLFGLWDKIAPGRGLVDLKYLKGAYFPYRKLHPNKPINTLTTSPYLLMHYSEKRYISKQEAIFASTFPSDYKAVSKSALYFAMGMTVPPIMMAQIAYQIKEQWLDKIK